MSSNSEKILELAKTLGIPSVYICSYIFEKKGYGEHINGSEVQELSKIAKMLDNHIKEGVKQICTLDGMGEDHLSIYDMVIDNKKLCEYFMSSKIDNITSSFKKVKGTTNKPMIHQFFSKIDSNLSNVEVNKYSPWR